MYEYKYQTLKIGITKVALPIQTKMTQTNSKSWKKADARPLRDANRLMILSTSFFRTRFAYTYSMQTTDCSIETAPSCFWGRYSSAWGRWKTSRMCLKWLGWCSKLSPPLQSVEGNHLVRFHAGTQEHLPRILTWRHHCCHESFWTYLAPRPTGPCPVHNDEPPAGSFAVSAGSLQLHRRAHKVYPDRFMWSVIPVQ